MVKGCKEVRASSKSSDILSKVVHNLDWQRFEGLVLLQTSSSWWPCSPVMAGAVRSWVVLGSFDAGRLLYRFVLMPLLEKVSLDRTGV